MHVRTHSATVLPWSLQMDSCEDGGGYPSHSVGLHVLVLERQQGFTPVIPVIIRADGGMLRGVRIMLVDLT